jgi:hypothetical protein
MTLNDPESRTHHGQVVAKAAMLIVVVGATGVGLLTERQRRFEAAHAMTIAHRQADALEREIRKLRAEVADRLTPVRLDAIVARDETLSPILWAARPAGGPAP